MKKKLLFIVSFMAILLIALTGCGIIRYFSRKAFIQMEE